MSNIHRKTNAEIAISSIILAIQMINIYTKKLKYRRKIVLVTNGEGSMSSEGLEEIISKMKSDNIELVVLYVPISTSMRARSDHCAEESTLMIRSTASRKKTKIQRRYASFITCPFTYTD